jgi:hypothetical protein
MTEGREAHMVRRLRRAMHEMRLHGEPMSIHLTEQDWADFRFEWRVEEVEPFEMIWGYPFFNTGKRGKSHVRGPFGRIVELVSEAIIEDEHRRAVERAPK